MSTDIKEVNVKFSVNIDIKKEKVRFFFLKSFYFKRAIVMVTKWSSVMKQNRKSEKRKYTEKQTMASLNKTKHVLPVTFFSSSS